MKFAIKLIPALILAIGLSAPAALSQPINTTIEPLTLDKANPFRSSFGKLIWRGGFSISSQDKRFGGFSGIALSKDGSRFAAISDRGWWLNGKFISPKNNLTGASNLAISKIKIAPRRRRLSHNWFDAEALSPWDQRGIDGRLIIGFERHVRANIYRFGKYGPKASSRLLPVPKAASSAPFNSEIEAIGRFYSGPKKGWMLVVSEENFDANGNIKAWLWKPGRSRKTKQKKFSLARNKAYAITALAVAPDGKTFFTLERSFNLPSLPGFAIRRFKTADINNGATAKGEMLFAGKWPRYSIDNMEGLAIHKTPKGNLSLTLISDDNYNSTLQQTIIFRFELKPDKS